MANLFVVFLSSITFYFCLFKALIFLFLKLRITFAELSPLLFTLWPKKYFSNTLLHIK